MRRGKESKRLWQGFAGVALSGFAMLGHAADNAGPVQAVWKVQEIRYDYVGFTVAYNCDTAQSRIKGLLRAMGAHKNTRVSTNGCESGRPSSHFTITISTAIPVPLADQPKGAEGLDREKLLKRLDLSASDIEQPFLAEWKSVDLAHVPRLRIKGPDCELMRGLRDSVLPAFAASITKDRIECQPHQTTTQIPELSVSVLQALAADESKPKS